MRFLYVLLIAFAIQILVVITAIYFVVDQKPAATVNSESFKPNQTRTIRQYPQHYPETQQLHGQPLSQQQQQWKHIENKENEQFSIADVQQWHIDRQRPSALRFSERREKHLQKKESELAEYYGKRADLAKTYHFDNYKMGSSQYDDAVKLEFQNIAQQMKKDGHSQKEIDAFLDRQYRKYSAEHHQEQMAQLLSKKYDNRMDYIRKSGEPATVFLTKADPRDKTLRRGADGKYQSIITYSYNADQIDNTPIRYFPAFDHQKQGLKITSREFAPDQNSKGELIPRIAMQGLDINQ